MIDLEKYKRLSNIFNYHLDKGDTDKAEIVRKAMDKLLKEIFEIE